MLHRKTRADRMKAKLREIKDALTRCLLLRFLTKGVGCSRRCAGTSRTTRCRPTTGRWPASATASPRCGDACCAGEARRRPSPGTVCAASSMRGCRFRESFNRGRASAFPSSTRGRSRMREFRTYGSVRGVPGNTHPYRDRTPRRMFCKVRLDSPNEEALAGEHCLRGAGGERERVFQLAPPAIRTPHRRRGSGLATPEDHAPAHECHQIAQPAADYCQCGDGCEHDRHVQVVGIGLDEVP